MFGVVEVFRDSGYVRLFEYDSFLGYSNMNGRACILKRRPHAHTDLGFRV